MKTRAKKIPDAYLELIQRFALRPIRTDIQHSDAVALLVELDGKPDLSRDERDYANTLALLVKDYERPRVNLKSSVIDRLRHLMAETGMNISAIGKVIGSQSAASMILSGERELSKDHIRKLAARFNLDAGFFL